MAPPKNKNVYPNNIPCKRTAKIQRNKQYTTLTAKKNVNKSQGTERNILTPQNTTAPPLGPDGRTGHRDIPRTRRPGHRGLSDREMDRDHGGKGKFSRKREENKITKEKSSRLCQNVH